MAAKKKAKKKKPTAKKRAKKQAKKQAKKKRPSSPVATGGRKAGKGDRRTLGDYLCERITKNTSTKMPPVHETPGPPPVPAKRQRRRRSRRGR